MGHAANGGDQSDRKEIVKIPRPSMVEAGYLEVIIKNPVMSCGSGKWPEFCFLVACYGGEQVGWQMLPLIKKEQSVMEVEEGSKWELSLRIPVGLDWPTQSHYLTVKRVDYIPWETGLELINDGPHISRHDAEIGGARVQLTDALLIGDVDEDEEGNDRKKRRHEEARGYFPRMEGTLVFNKTVALEDWAPAELGAVDNSPRLVKRGTMEVLMAMFETQNQN